MEEWASQNERDTRRLRLSSTDIRLAENSGVDSRVDDHQDAWNDGAYDCEEPYRHSLVHCIWVCEGGVGHAEQATVPVDLPLVLASSLVLHSFVSSLTLSSR